MRRSEYPLMVYIFIQQNLIFHQSVPLTVGSVSMKNIVSTFKIPLLPSLILCCRTLINAIAIARAPISARKNKQTYIWVRGLFNVFPSSLVEKSPRGILFGYKMGKSLIDA